MASDRYACRMRAAGVSACAARSSHTRARDAATRSAPRRSRSPARAGAQPSPGARLARAPPCATGLRPRTRSAAQATRRRQRSRTRERRQRGQHRQRGARVRQQRIRAERGGVHAAPRARSASRGAAAARRRACCRCRNGWRACASGVGAQRLQMQRREAGGGGREEVGGHGVLRCHFAPPTPSRAMQAPVQAPHAFAAARLRSSGGARCSGTVAPAAAARPQWRASRTLSRPCGLAASSLAPRVCAAARGSRARASRQAALSVSASADKELVADTEKSITKASGGSRAFAGMSRLTPAHAPRAPRRRCHSAPSG
jgi:hypothetical protein